MDRQNDGWTDRMMDGQTDQWMTGTYRGIDCQLIRGRHCGRWLIKIIITLEEFVIIVLDVRP